MKNSKKYSLGTLSVLVASSLLTTSVSAEETKVKSPAVEQTVAPVVTTAAPVVTTADPAATTAAPVVTTASARVTAETTVAPVPEHELDIAPQKKLTPEEQAYIDNYLQELSKAAGGKPVGLMSHEVDALLKKMKEDKNRQVQKPNVVTTTSQQTTSDDKNENLEHSVVEDKEIEKGLYSVKFVTLDKKTDKKKVHDFKKEENNKDKEKEQVDYSKEPARVGTTPGAAYAIVELEDGVYGQLVADRKTGKKLITVKYDLLKETIEKGSWEYKDEEVVEVKKEDADDKVEETTTTKSR